MWRRWCAPWAVARAAAVAAARRWRVECVCVGGGGMRGSRSGWNVLMRVAAPRAHTTVLAPAMVWSNLNRRDGTRWRRVPSVPCWARARRAVVPCPLLLLRRRQQSSSERTAHRYCWHTSYTRGRTSPLNSRAAPRAAPPGSAARSRARRPPAAAAFDVPISRTGRAYGNAYCCARAHPQGHPEGLHRRARRLHFSCASAPGS